MGILNQNRYPKPNSWNEFEDMATDIIKSQYQSMSINRYGRQGQSQKGIDILVVDPNLTIGIQCKNVQSLSPNDIDDIIKNIEIEIDIIMIFVTTSRDVNIINHIIQKIKQINKQIQIVFWEDVINHLSTYNLIQKYYPQFFNDDFRTKKDRELFAEFYEDFQNSGLRNYLDRMQSIFKFNDEKMSILFFLTEKWSSVDYMFHYPEIENCRKELLEVLNILSNDISLKTWSVDSENHAIPSEWIVEQPERYKETTEKIDLNLSKFTYYFNNLIYLGKRYNLI